MNFLSHHRAARLALTDPTSAFLVGNILPDIAKKRLRWSELDATELRDLAQGVRFHEECDRAFHSDEEFVRLCGVVGDSLRGLGLTPPPRRVFFLAHVAVELALDGVLLRNEASLADNLLAHLPPVRSLALGALAQWRPAASDEDRLLWAQRYDRFVADRFVERYIDDGQLASSLNHLARQVGDGLLPEDDGSRKRVADWFADVRTEVGPAAEGLVRRAGRHGILSARLEPLGSP